jgi:hypothetical protein
MRAFIFSVILFAALGSSLGAAPVEKILYSKCLPIEGYGNVCVEATSVDCFELSARLTVDNVSFYNQALPLPSLVRQVKNLLADPPLGQPKDYVCYRIDSGVGVGQCKVCANVSELKIDGDDFKFCGKIDVGCESFVAGTFNRSFDVPCIDIQDCKLFGCPNNCTSHGTCDSFGFCDCRDTYSGPDCSAYIDQTNYCITSDFVNKTCWKTFFPNCRTVEFEVLLGNRQLTKVEQSIDSTHSLNLLPWINMTGFDACKMAVIASNVSVQGDSLFGCPSLQVSCNGYIVENFPYGCMKLAQSKALLCNSTQNTPDSGNPPESKSNKLSTARIVMWVAVGGVVVALLAAGGYFVFSRLIRKPNDGLYGYDVVQLNAGDDNDDDDVAPLRSPFAGSSDDE